MNKLEALERRVPLASDKALINLVNGIQVNRDIIHYRKSRGFFGQLFDELLGTDRGGQILLDGNLIAGQQALCDWVLELTDSLSVSQVALELTQNSLLEARAAIRRQKEDLSIQKQDLSILFNNRLEELTQKVGDRLCNIESRIRNLELNVAAQRDFERIVTAWEARQTYMNLPWVIQVTMLIREVFSSAVIKYELETGDIIAYRKQLINRILRASDKISDKPFSLSDLLEVMWQQARNLEDLELSLGILEIRSLGQSRIQRIPLLFTIATTLELSTLPENARPPKPARCAIELCRRQVQEIDYTTDMTNFVTAITYETASDSLFSIARSREELI